MKKLLSVFAALTLATTSTVTLISCNKDKNVIKITMTPGTFPIAEFNKLLQPLEKGLYNEMKKNDKKFRMKFRIRVGTDSKIALESIKTGTSALGFISTNKYEGTIQDELENDPVRPLVIAMKNPMKADVDVLGDELESGELTEEQAFQIAKKHDNNLKTINFNDPNWDINSAIEKPGDTLIKYYRTYVYVNNEVLKKSNYKLSEITSFQEYKIKTKKLIMDFIKGKKEQELIMASGAASSYHFPLMWMRDKIGLNKNELKEVEERKKKPQNGLMGVRDSLTNGPVIAFGLGDIRALNTEKDTEKEKIKKALDNSSIIGVSDPILNEGIFYSKAWMYKRGKNTTFVNNLRKSFKELSENEQYKHIFEKLKIFGYDMPEDLEDEWTSDEWEENYRKLALDERKRTKDIEDLINEKEDKPKKNIGNY